MSIKDKIKKASDNPEESKTYGLTDFEYRFIENLIINTQLITKQNNMTASAFLSYIAGTRLGYKTGENLRFELDDKKHEVTITPVPEDEAVPIDKKV